MSRSRVLAGLPSHAVNGLTVALGVALLQVLVAALGGTAAALLASGGAICASLADHPMAPLRTRTRVLTAAAVGCLASALVLVLRAHPLLLGMGTAVLGFGSSLALVWGLRAGPVGFAAVLALVFNLAAPPVSGAAAMLAHWGWTVLGAALYTGWALGCSQLLQPRLRRMALAEALTASAELLRSRGEQLDAGPPALRGSSQLQHWITRQTQLDDGLQNARDLLFAHPDAPGVPRQIAALLQAIDLRDTLLGSQLDLDLLGDDAPAERFRRCLADGLREIAGALDLAVDALRADVPLEQVAPPPEVLRSRAEARLAELAGAVPFDPAQPRARLARAVSGRTRHMVDDVGRLHAALRAPTDPAGVLPRLPLDATDLQLFVSPEGWPLKALRTHWTLRSPVMRHALRTGIALGTAYFIGLALPWASHPHWLVLSVAVVLRGNLEQTLSRRDARVFGTVIGCLVVAALAFLAVPALTTVAFIVGVGVAHAFVQRRYLLTAVGATVMALLQAHLAHPDGGFGVVERLADTVLGALLAWGFSYVLPWWERRNLDNLVARVLKSLAALSHEVLRWRDGGPAGADLPLRLARRDVYDAIGAIAATAQRTGVEPGRVRLPLPELSALLEQCHALLGQLAAVNNLLMRRGSELDRREAEVELQTVAAQMDGLLAPEPAAVDLPSPMPLAADATLALPPTGDVLLAWMRRRLHMASVAAAGVARSASALRLAVR